MSDRAIHVDPARGSRRALRLLSLSATLLIGGAVGCGDSGTVTVPKASRARIISDADAEGNIVLPKTKKAGRPAAGLKTARSILDRKNAKVD